ncbi:hypothetical protein [Limosilactobacillus agrestis]|uniref:hypothetical protein n=1 Tax=Limosilactobacillus agrestis TaxID=2759748 RepID=UPI001E62FC86|nr:hypothetical protein [Limosilactobacillus agrestis]
MSLPTCTLFKKLIKRGNLIVSGPRVNTPVKSAMFIFPNLSKDKLNELIAKDPFSKCDLVAFSTINHWDVKYGNLKKTNSSISDNTKYYRVTYKLSKDPTTIQPEISTYMNKLVDQHILRAGGPYLNDKNEELLIIESKNKADIKTVSKQSPLTTQFDAIYQIAEWDPRFEDFK